MQTARARQVKKVLMIDLFIKKISEMRHFSLFRTERQFDIFYLIVLYKKYTTRQETFDVVK